MATPDESTVMIKPAQWTRVPDRARPRNNEGCLRIRVTEQLNSRLHSPLPAGKWKLNWKAKTHARMPPHYLLQTHHRILVPLDRSVELFDRTGKFISAESSGEGEVVADPSHNLFYTPTTTGHIVARKLDNGQQVFATSGFGGRSFRRQFIARRGNALLSLSVEFLAHPHTDQLPSQSALEVQELGEPMRVTESGLLLSAAIRAQRELETLRAHVALHDDTVVIALKDKIEIVDLDLKRKRELAGSFNPQAISLDEAGNIYLINQVAENLSLWVVTPDADRVQDVLLPPAAAPTTITPPIVGYDHTAYAVVGSTVTAILPNGQIAWSHSFDARVAAHVTANDRLLVATGSDLIAIDPNGDRQILFRFPGEVIETPPVLTSTGEILVASQQHLYCLISE